MSLAFQDWQIIELVVLGKGNKDIGFKLGIEESMVKYCLNRMYEILGIKGNVSKRVALAVMVLKDEILFKKFKEDFPRTVEMERALDEGNFSLERIEAISREAKAS